MIYDEQEFRENMRFYVRASFIQLTCLREEGLDESDQVRLGFKFEALHPSALEKLQAFLKTQGDYKIHISEKERAYLLDGLTGPTPLSLEIINTWVNWMCRAGEACDCLFAGWEARCLSARPTTTSIRIRDWKKASGR